MTFGRGRDGHFLFGRGAARKLQPQAMKPFRHVLAGALLVGASVPALAQTALPMNPEEAIPDNLPRMTAPGPYDDFIKQVQQKLNELGFDAGPVNGDFGEKTQAALAQFQLANLLPASGALDDGTLRGLGIQRPGEAEPSAASDGDNAAAGSTQPADAR
jgi:peptidoglycan hydrolase-like protein with peptidoglycan-binding domain